MCVPIVSSWYTHCVYRYPLPTIKTKEQTANEKAVKIRQIVSKRCGKIKLYKIYKKSKKKRVRIISSNSTVASVGVCTKIGTQEEQKAGAGVRKSRKSRRTI